MNISEVRNAIIPKIKAFCNVPVIEADGVGSKPDGPHVIYKFTTTYGKDAGREVEMVNEGENGYIMRRQVSYKSTISINAYDMDDDTSMDLAQKVFDWFEFYGSEDLLAANIAVVEMSNITNRDAFVVENYERRNGFDVIIRISRELERGINYIDRVETSGGQVN